MPTVEQHKPALHFVRNSYQNICVGILVGLGLGTIVYPDRFLKFFQLQYEVVGENGEKLYGAGVDDNYFVFMVVIALTLLRYVTHQYYLRPIAKWFGVRKERMIMKFNEASALWMWYSAAFAAGMYVLATEEKNWYTEGWTMDYIWEVWPELQSRAVVKYYLLIQLAMWIHCLFVINIEEKRKDYWEMTTHHVATILLVQNSFAYGWCRAGIFLQTLLDCADVWLYGLKITTYIGWRNVGNNLFIFFMLLWAVTRHVVYNMFVYSYAFVMPTVIPDTPPAWMYPTHLTAFVVLQACLIFWFFIIVRMAWKFATSKDNVVDERSDSDADYNDDLADMDEKKDPLPGRRAKKE